MFKIKLSKSKDQQTITIRRADAYDLSGVSEIIAKVYTDDIGTADNSYTLDAGEVSSFIAGVVEISTSDLLGATADEFYTVYLECDSASIISYPAGVAMTLTAMYNVFSKQGFVDVYSPDFRLDRVLMSAFMLFEEMNNIEEQEYSLQKRTDFTVRESILKKILNYE